MDTTGLLINLSKIAVAIMAAAGLIFVLPTLLKPIVRNAKLEYVIAGADALIAAYIAIYYVIIPLSNWLPSLLF